MVFRNCLRIFVSVPINFIELLPGWLAGRLDEFGLNENGCFHSGGHMDCGVPRYGNMYRGVSVWTFQRNLLPLSSERK